MPLRNLMIIVTTAAIAMACYVRTKRDRDAAVLYETINIIDQNYYEPVDRRLLFEGAMRGMVSQLDEHSAYFSPEELHQFEESLDQEFGGIGIVVELNPQTGRLTVLSPLVGTPAHRAGMRAGDVILQIDGQDTEGMTLKDAVALMRGMKGQPVELLVLHAGEKEPVHYRIERDIIPIESVLGDLRREDGGWNYYLEDYPDIGYIRLTTFGEHTAGEMEEALQFNGRAVKALILDLRGNAGGLLTTAVQVADMFLSKGRIVSTVGRGGVVKTFYDATPEVKLDPAIPMAVMTNHYSASASEIVAACLQDHGRAVVVGERSWGKGTVQNIIELAGTRGALKLTTASYWRPSGRNIHRRKDATEDEDWGVRPNPGLEVKLTDEQFKRLMEFRRNRDFGGAANGGKDDSQPDESTPPEADQTEQDVLLYDPQLQKAVDYLLQQIGPKQLTAKAA